MTVMMTLKTYEDDLRAERLATLRRVREVVDQADDRDDAVLKIDAMIKTERRED